MMFLRPLLEMAASRPISTLADRGEKGMLLPQPGRTAASRKRRAQRTTDGEAARDPWWRCIRTTPSGTA
jgi:hypothetical protein